MALSLITAGRLCRPLFGHRRILTQQARTHALSMRTNFVHLLEHIEQIPTGLAATSLIGRIACDAVLSRYVATRIAKPILDHPLAGCQIFRRSNDAPCITHAIPRQMGPSRNLSAVSNCRNLVSIRRIFVFHGKPFTPRCPPERRCSSLAQDLRSYRILRPGAVPLVPVIARPRCSDASRRAYSQRFPSAAARSAPC